MGRFTEELGFEILQRYWRTLARASLRKHTPKDADWA
jgi:hypothetical protein